MLANILTRQNICTFFLLVNISLVPSYPTHRPPFGPLSERNINFHQRPLTRHPANKQHSSGIFWLACWHDGLNGEWGKMGKLKYKIEKSISWLKCSNEISATDKFIITTFFFLFLIFNIIPRSVPEDNSKEKIKYNFMKYLFSQIINNVPSFLFGCGNWWQVNCWLEQGGRDESNALGGWGVWSWGSARMFFLMGYPCRECIFHWGRCSVNFWKISSS